MLEHSSLTDIFSKIYARHRSGTDFWNFRDRNSCQFLLDLREIENALITSSSLSIGSCIFENLENSLEKMTLLQSIRTRLTNYY